MDKDKNAIDSGQTGLETAVIGMAARFPGTADIGRFWTNLKSGVESLCFFTDRELEEAGVNPRLLENSNYVRAGGVLENADVFDAPFFDYTHREAEVMDPQVRIFHEITWKALEDAGYDAQRYPGLIGLYAGAAPNSLWEIQTLLAGMKGKSSLDTFSAAQLSDKDYLCTRVSYKLDLKGPSFPVYTTCSTSLVAIHLGVQALLGGECDMAAAGGVRVTYPRETGYLYQEGMVYSPDGHCRAFDAKAGGTVGGEGAAVVVLKRLGDALRDRDNIYGVIKGSAVNNDGKRKVGFTAPSIKGQLEVIKATFRMADVSPESISYIETHGTGTIMGDPVEIEALKMVFNTDKKGFCALGSVKTNIGHTDAAAGAAGLIKAVLALKYNVIPPTLHFETPNPEIDFENSPFYVNTELVPWKRPEGYPRRAGVSSFGIGGTNAHVILEEWPEIRRSDGQKTDAQKAERPQLILLSAKTPSALDRMTENLGNYLKDNHGNPGNPINPGFRLADAAYTLQVGRGEFDCRRMLVCSSLGEAVESLTLKEGKTYEAYHKSEKLRTFFKRVDHWEVIFMFPGQGAQYVDMGRDLYRTEPVFRETMDRCFTLLKPLLGYDMSSSIKEWSSLERVKQAEIIQPFIFTFEYSLAQLLMAWGIRPQAMIGYSLGEYPAVCLSGVLSLEEALDLVVFRGRLTAQQPERVMLNVPLAEEELQVLLKEDGFDDVSIAVVNEPSCIAAGSREAIERLKNRLKEKRVLSMWVDVPQATHWVMTDTALAEFQQKIRQLNIKEPGIPFISCVTGEWVTAKDVQDPVSWSRLLHDTVRFSRGIRNLLEIKKEKNPVFIEVGPGRDLTVMVKRYIDEKAGQQAVNLVRPQQQEIPDDYYLLERIGRLWLSGVPIDWQGYYKTEKRFRVSLPTYSFDAYKYQMDTKIFRFIADMLSGKEVHIQGLASAGPEPGTAMQPPPETLYEYSDQGRSTAYAAPRSALEYQLVDLWQDFFGLRQVGIDDDFFDMGGDSLKAVHMVNRIHRETDVRVPLEEFFKRSTIRVLSEYIETADKEAFQFINTTEEKKYYPLSPAQKRNYILQQMSPDSVGYNLGAVVTLEGILDKEKFEKIFKKLIKRHESFRTSFIMIEKEPIQRIHDDVEFEIEYHEAGRTAQNAERIIKNFTRPFDLSRAPLLRVGLIKEEEEKHIFMVDMHHIITDGTSLAIVIREFTILYKGGTLPPLNFRYRDFCQWLVQDGMARVEKEKQYWLTQFETDVPVMDLPCDFPRPEFQGFAGNTIPFLLERTETNVLKKYAKEADATLYMVVLTLFNIFIAKLTGQEDIVVGTPVAGRSHPDLQQIAGVFVNTLAMRNYPNGNLPFNRFLEQVKKRTLAAFDNQEYPFEELVEIVTAQGRLQRDVSRNPIFDLFFSFENVNIPKIKMPGLALKPFDSKRIVAIFDLSLYCLEADNDDDDRLLCRIEYSTKLFKEETIQRFIGYFRKIVSAIVADPTVKTADIEIITEDERRQILEEFNDTQVDYSIDKTVHRLFAEQAEKRPDNIAVVGKSVRTRSIASVTYGEINQKSEQLSHLLREKGVGPDTIVGIMVERSLEMIIGILAILKAGGACLPIDPDYPTERIDYMLAESKVKILLSEVSKVSEGTELVQLSELSEELTTHLTHLTHLTHPTHLCYVIYTSGTTGKPKGVVLEHRTLVNLTEYQYRFTSIDFSRVLQFAALTFDVSFQEISSTLGCGGTLYLIHKDMRSNVTELFTYVRQHYIKTLFLPTAFLKFIQGNDDYLKCIPAGVDHIVMAGEQLIVNRGLKDYLRTHRIHLHNHYGPSETHVVTALSMAPGEDIADIPSIGKPLSNTGIYIIDPAGHLQPVGVVGELLIGGFQVARGYLNNPQLTAEKFLFTAYKSYRSYKTYISKQIYKTGDLARWLADGNIEFLGRRDRQVKIRGFRVELGEIESQLLSHPHVKEAVVVDRQREGGEKYLCAYVANMNNVGAAELREYLSRTLPDYMIPAHFIPMEKIPLTSNGKVNKRVLPEPQVEALKEGAAAAPQNPIEKKLAELWSEILGIELSAIGTDDNFFQLGGHSLKATLLVSNIHKEFNARVQLAEVFRTPTIRGLAQHIEESVEEAFVSIQPVEEKEHYILSSAQRRIFILSQVDENSITYNIPSIVGLEGVIHLDWLEAALRQLIRRQEILRTSFHTIHREPRQRIHPVDEISFAIEYIEYLDSPASTVKDFIRPFDLSRAPLMRVGLIKTDEKNHVLVVDMHHIITDGTSLGIFVRELLAFYSGQQLPELRLRYKDFAEWQTGVQRSEDLDKSMKKQEQYWLKQFEGDIPQLAMSTDFPRPPVQSFEGNTIVFEIDTHWTAEIRELVRETGTTIYMVLLAIFNILLSKYSIQDDIVVGTGVAGRRHADLQNLIGMFVNMLPMRNYPREEKCFNEFLQEVKKNAVDAFENQEYQFEELVDKLDIPRDSSRNPIFDVEFTLQNTEAVEMNISIPDIQLRPFEAIEIEKTKFDLVLQAGEGQGKIYLSLSYSTKLFKRSTAEKMSQHYQEVLQQVLENRKVKLGDIHLSHKLSAAPVVINKEETLFGY
ncbi:MAG: amino acid adenylation domain-containing protein [Candidatus Aminicenantes bacterium]|nr:amino acid adenylation domain-containing protein [Candidatus Aminicenantes bacterium]NIM77281.1 amino acid adenylation domain-containing protein [Candidatus Aminicenantes bacterium]NIN16582.1 amino acid adenylation domain-containing protein [Candidatus Aminicenantes bacterium]NIN40440.1 amino acid adenylation domain-containing protein [Candidatus Aminicenantes bacterium]NIN83260.1 amino acid adenylation domain-containing protein [Candidatus Aminicenantes bacterium]